MRCADCKHFEADGSPAGFGHCSRWHEGYGIAESDMATNEALVENDEGWGNVVGPDFGCVLFEPSPPKA